MEETWVNLIIQSQYKTGILCKNCALFSKYCLQKMCTEGLSEEFIEEGGHRLCHVGQKWLRQGGKNEEVRQLEQAPTQKT